MNLERMEHLDKQAQDIVLDHLAGGVEYFSIVELSDEDVTEAELGYIAGIVDGILARLKTELIKEGENNEKAN